MVKLDIPEFTISTQIAWDMMKKKVENLKMSLMVADYELSDSEDEEDIKEKV